MPLPLPNLDDRRWVDLVQEGQSLIPFYAPEWTDYNVSDPGITLAELFAWLAEMDIYQLNRIPERHRLKFLALVGLRPLPPQAARSVLSFRLQPVVRLLPSLHLPAEVEFEAKDPFGCVVRFRTLDALDVVDSQLQAIQSDGRKGYQDLTPRWRRGEGLLPLGDDPQPGAALCLGFDQTLSSDLTVSLYFSFAGRWAEDGERQRLLEEIEAHRLDCRPPASLVTCGGEQPAGDPGPQMALRHHSVTTVWEFLDEQGRWQRVEAAGGQVEDATRALTLSGRVQVKLPAPMGAARLGQVAQDLYYLRCRLLAGAYEAAPEIQSLALNAVAAEQAVTPAKLSWSLPGPADSGAEPLGAGANRPLQQVETSERPVLESSFKLYTQENGECRVWEQRPDFDASQPGDYHFTLDAGQGQVTFGDGRRGRVVPKGAAIMAYYLTTRAEQGNLPAGSVLALVDNLQNRRLLPDFAWAQQQLAGVTNPVPASGGAAAEDLAHAEGRAFERAGELVRAITLEDIEKLAMQTPGVHLARAWAQANRHPAFPCFQAPGVITLVVLPCLPLQRPAPSAALRRRVAAYVMRRRVIGTRLEVIGPTYTQVTVVASVCAFAGASPTALRARIDTALNRFFHPLTGGPAGQGWPFGRDVYRSEVLQVIDETPGVDHVLSLEIIADGGQPQCGNLCLGPAGLVAAGPHQIEIEIEGR